MTKPMKLHFDTSQTYQLDVVDAFVDLFEGQTLEQANFSIEKNTIPTGQTALFQS